MFRTLKDCFSDKDHMLKIHKGDVKYWGEGESRLPPHLLNDPEVVQYLACLEHAALENNITQSSGRDVTDNTPWPIRKDCKFCVYNDRFTRQPATTTTSATPSKESSEKKKSSGIGINEHSHQ